MKKSEMINKLTEYLKEWENCKLNKKCAKGILSLMEENGHIQWEPEEIDEITLKNWSDRYGKHEE
jgi:hypothetical protein